MQGSKQPVPGLEEATGQRHPAVLQPWGTLGGWRGRRARTPPRDTQGRDTHGAALACAQRGFGDGASDGDVTSCLLQDPLPAPSTVGTCNGIAKPRN